MGNSIKNKNLLYQMIQTKSITLQAACLAYANALALQSKLLAEAQSQDIFDDIADWTLGAVNDIGDWTINAYHDVTDWTEKAFHDVGDAFSDAASWTENAFEDAYDWAKEGDNWEALGTTTFGSMALGFSGDWEGGWDMFTDSSNYYGEEPHGDCLDPNGCDTRTNRDREYQEAMRKQAEMCAAYNPKVNQPQPDSRYTITDDFNYQLMKARVPFDSVYAPLGDLSDPNHKMIEPRDCEDVDCMHPCYGKNQYGACGKCVSHLLENNGARH